MAVAALHGLHGGAKFSHHHIEKVEAAAAADNDDYHIRTLPGIVRRPDLPPSPPPPQVAMMSKDGGSRMLRSVGIAIGMLSLLDSAMISEYGQIMRFHLFALAYRLRELTFAASKAQAAPRHFTKPYQRSVAPLLRVDHFPLFPIPPRLITATALPPHFY